MSGTTSPPAASELALVTADLKTILDSSQAASTAKKAQLHALVAVVERDLAAAKEALGEFFPSVKADIRSAINSAEKDVEVAASSIRAGTLSVWHKAGSLLVGAVAGGVILVGMAWAGVHFF
jgi:ElaB/YqjD/DUF883 family membrane-anchored ribosome-binding protein